MSWEGGGFRYEAVLSWLYHMWVSYIYPHVWLWRDGLFGLMDLSLVRFLDQQLRKN